MKRHIGLGAAVAGLFLAHRENPGLTLPEFLARSEVHYKVLVPNRGRPELLTRYPFLGRDMEKASGNASWEIAFDQAGTPL